MTATVHPIEGRRKAEQAIASTADFVLAAAQSADPAIVLDPTWSLYTIDRERRLALFVELPPELDLAQAAFVYDAQFRAARRVALVPLSELPVLADRIAAPSHMFFILGIGRSGTTLVSRLLNRVPGVWCLSEPDVFTRLSLERGRLGGVEVGDLFRAATRLLFRPPREAGAFGIKLRSQSLSQAELLHNTFPEADFVFMYRDGLSWAKSFYEMMRMSGMPGQLPIPECFRPWWTVTNRASVGYMQGMVDLTGNREVPIEEMLAAAWAFNIEAYLAMLHDGVPFHALRYNELIGDRKDTVAALLRHCHLPEHGLDDALGAFARDSQEGTALARDRKTADIAFTAENAGRFAGVLAKHPSIKSPDILVPDIYHRDGIARFADGGHR